ncbi:hypothetical protein Ahy_Scaffold6g108062 [Arachis hypogaea]|uniref:Pectinesterase inhibitor domain-containing protein n=1 Tax=Arachis hypogaea TaxID=3818 RepID=A0A444WP99_ARAHY|nr:hypothetical protein Ahy_Scaffold6g108062 [Arachis hypogaea]
MTKNLNHLSLIFTVLVLSIISMMPIGQSRVFHSNDERLIHVACNRTPYLDLCVQILNSYPSSTNADLRVIVLNIVDFIKSKINYYIEQDASTPTRLGALDSCIDHYNNGILKGDVPQAISGIKAAFTDEAYSCEQGFNGSSPLSKENNAVRDAANIAKVIALQDFSLFMGVFLWKF